MIIKTPRRLHLGLIDPSGSLGRRFGSLGVALEEGYEIKLMPHEKLEIRAEREDKETIKFIIGRMNKHFSTGFNYLVEVRKAIPRHIGLGSTTQLSLAVGVGIAKLNNINAELEELAEIFGRGKNSGAGIYTFKYGGFVIDGGVKEGIPPLIFREEFPKNWAFLLVIPQVKRGFNEEEEKPIMASIRGKSEIAKEISHRILLGLLPSLKERDIKTFGKHLSEIQRLVGKHFEDYQGGEFREDVKLIMEFLRENTYGYGQSSWGPTVYGLIQKNEYSMLKAKLHDFLKDYGLKAEIELGIPRNKGAEIVMENAYLLRLINSVAKG
ncbi:beta-ribofuranosylaminobenzene 5'-phosphate synthase family protein [Thermococcus barophilus]|uniref:Beta-ribofuranosylaminobenzene 5'-phosphate synthase n=1 Tax=Thermococcus barophilus (strain DSM 11836 / MP) TaxID=391623 RepID=F0LJF4_THEBM|nr:beta-ribofuranosylaminobenzene 5'-phosphate synthase family protein [Thermococcus barophilus]ADT83420.1 beta-ribofuranosylaminobenzene 5'-phosphate synthase [Thermococcus barophilus MP]